MIQLFDEQLARQTADLDVQHRQLLSHVESKVREAFERINERMQLTTTDADTAAEKQAEAIRTKAAEAIKPFIESIEDHLAKFQKRAQQSALAAEATLRDRLRKAEGDVGKVTLVDPEQMEQAMDSVSRKINGRTTPTRSTHAA